MGIDLKHAARRAAIIAALAVFVGLPLLLYALGDFPRRSVMKESISIVTLLAFTMMLGQFFLARSNVPLLSLFEPVRIQRFHKWIAYSAVGVILVHPFLVVLPRFFEAGVKPGDAFVTMLTTLDSNGIRLGLAAWLLLLVLSMTAFFRKSLIHRFKYGYLGWRYFHGGLAVAFTGLAIWHGVELGRHTEVPIATYFIMLAIIGVVLLARLYWGTRANKPQANPVPDVASP